MVIHRARLPLLPSIRGIAINYDVPQKYSSKHNYIHRYLFEINPVRTLEDVKAWTIYVGSQHQHQYPYISAS